MVHWRSWLGRLRHSPRRGQALVVFALAMPVLIGAAGLILDSGYLYYQRRHIQGIADAAALTGAQRANFRYDAPLIDPDGSVQAFSNAVYNGAAPSEILVNLPPVNETAKYYYNNSQYIEVTITRQVPHTFMRVFGLGTTTITAHAVARCVKPGYGDPAVLALDRTDEDALTWNGGGNSSVNIIGDAISRGGFDTNGNQSHFNITGSAYALNGSAPNVTASGGSYGTNSNVTLLDIPDPIAQGVVAGTVIWPTWPTTAGCIDRYEEGNGQNAGTWSWNNNWKCGDNSLITLHSGHDYRIWPGTYKSIRIQTSSDDEVTFQPGIFVFSDELGLGSQTRVTGNGVLFRLNGLALVTDVTGGAEFTFTAIQPNTWKNIVFYSPDGDIDLNGNGNRRVNGSIYAPGGYVDIAGNASQSVVAGQVIAQKVRFSGNGPAVEYHPGSIPALFTPVLVNTPD